MRAGDPAPTGHPPLEERDCPRDPLLLFARWHRAAIDAGLPEPSAMTLATVAEDGGPAARIVLLRDCDARGFVFLTDSASRKGRELARDARAALVFHWPALVRQVRAEGEVAKLDATASAALYSARPRGTRLVLAAWTQSVPVADRATLAALRDRMDAAHPAPAAPERPATWEGYRLAPRLLEFWQGDRSRLHDRLRYRRAGDRDGEWIIDRLAP